MKRTRDEVIKYVFIVCLFLEMVRKYLFEVSDKYRRVFFDHV